MKQTEALLMTDFKCHRELVDLSVTCRVNESCAKVQCIIFIIFVIKLLLLRLVLMHYTLV